MISETELRLGNIVNDEFTTVIAILGGNNIKLNSRLQNDSNSKLVTTGDLTPVLLTEQILQLLEFEKDTIADFYSKITPDGNSIAVRPGPITYVYIYRGDYEHRTRISQQEQMPVHYFQNLYFVLTGIDCNLK